jgi:hypothetical protein
MAEVNVDVSKVEAGINRIVMLSLRSIGTFYKTAEEAIKEAYMKPLEANVSLEDHSLKILAELDHPYATRHGSIQSGSIGHDGWKVHKQHEGLFPTFRLIPEKSAAEVTSELERAAIVSGKGRAIFSPGSPGSLMLTWLVNSNSIITGYVEFGTKRMLPRPFAEETLKDRAQEITKEIRSKFKVAR